MSKFKPGDRVFTKQYLPCADGHAAILVGSVGDIIYTNGETSWVRWDFALGDSLIADRYLEKVSEFQPGLYRRRSEPTGYGYEIRWFDRLPNGEWVRI